MKKKLYAITILILVVMVSIFIMIIPTFFTKGISRVELNKKFDLPLILDDEKDVKLIFFGYSGCGDICTPRLFSLNDFYKALDTKTKKRVGVEFLDISLSYDKTLPTRFAQFFNPDFKGIYLKQNILRDYTKVFDVYFSKSLTDETAYDHTSNLYLVKKTKNKKELRYVYYSYPYDYTQINLDIKELLNE
jgi:protein SCO1/2